MIPEQIPAALVLATAFICPISFAAAVFGVLYYQLRKTGTSWAEFRRALTGEKGGPA